STGVTVTASNITVTGFTAATAGTASSPSGANGSFTFTVTLTKGGSTLTTPARSGVITATAFGATPYTVAVASTTNGSVTASPSGPVYAGTAVTLTLAPSTGYGVGTVRVYRTGTPSATVSLSGSGNTRTFTMPAGNVTVEVTFLPVVQLSAQQDVNNARLRIENATFNVSQATANTTSALRTWLVGQINSLIALTGVTVSASDITISGFTAATGGTAALPSGADGGYTFTVSLEKGGALAVTSAKAGRIIAIAYTPVQYAITLGTSINGRVTANAASAPAGATVTLTITPNTGYELDSIRAYHAGGASVPVTLSGSGSTRTFVMPASGVTVTIRFKKTPHQINIETVETAKISIEGGTYHIAQATGNTEASVESWLSGVLNLLLSGRNAVITFRSGEADVLAADAKLYSFTPAVVGTATHPAGTDGSFRFTVLLTKGDIHVETLEVNGVIVATPHAADPVKRIELLSLGETRVRIINTGNSETGNLTVGISGAHVDVFTLPSATSGSLSVGGEADLALVPRQDLAPGAYTVTVTVGGEGVTPVSLEIVYHVWSTGSEAVSGRQVWTAGSTLYIAAATAGEARVFGTAGQFVKAIPHAAGETVETVLPQGFYLVVAEGKTYKVLIR
ncbi:MAG: hypothetical protein LBP50_05025, partial [Tannerella sp.]|nr:hypothetical protein [Tannerella sp.]